MAHLGFHGGEVEVVTEPQLQPVVALRGFEVQRLPVDADEMRFAGRDGQIGAVAFDIDTRGVDSGEVHDDFHRVRLLVALIAGLTERLNGRPSRAMLASAGYGWIYDRVHGRK
jgi:hypothetical protein